MRSTSRLASINAITSQCDKMILQCRDPLYIDWHFNPLIEQYQRLIVRAGQCCLNDNLTMISNAHAVHFGIPTMSNTIQTLSRLCVGYTHHSIHNHEYVQKYGHNIDHKCAHKHVKPHATTIITQACLDYLTVHHPFVITQYKFDSLTLQHVSRLSQYRVLTRHQLEPA